MKKVISILVLTFLFVTLSSASDSVISKFAFSRDGLKNEIRTYEYCARKLKEIDTYTWSFTSLHDEKRYEELSSTVLYLSNIARDGLSSRTLDPLEEGYNCNIGNRREYIFVAREKLNCAKASDEIKKIEGWFQERRAEINEILKTPKLVKDKAASLAKKYITMTDIRALAEMAQSFYTRACENTFWRQEEPYLDYLRKKQQ